ncbi:MAG TPA: hypothetical protein VNY73_01745 [Bacteroidia bacterium]|nr:hypothetical protein [Bacteroidia bacterium]
MQAFLFHKKHIFLAVAGYLLFIICFIAALLPFTGGPKTWDELLYLDLSLNPKAMPIVLFRYTHIYFQKLFLLFFSGNVLLASKVFWLFLVGTSAWLIFRLTYLLSGKNLAAPFIAVYFFFMQSLVFQKYVGVTYADFTVMFFGVCMLSLYYTGLSDKVKLFCLSFLFVLAFKTKETSAPFILLPIAIFLQAVKEHGLKFILHAITGGISAILLFILLDAVFLKQPFFSLSPSSFSARASFDLFTEFERTQDNWMSYILRSTLLVPFIFYLKTLFESKDKTIYEQLVYIVPMFVILLLVISMISGNWGIEDRYVLPAIPYICIFGGLSVFKSNLQENNNKLTTIIPYLVLFLVAFGLSHFIEKYAVNHFRSLGWDNSTLHFGVFLPASLLLLFLGFIFQKKQGNLWLLNFLVIFPLVFYSATDLKGNIISLKRKDNVTESDLRFVPFATFKSDLQLKQGEKLLVSKNIYTNELMLGRDQKSLTWMYNIFFCTSTEPSVVRLDSVTSATQFLSYNRVLLDKEDKKLLDSMENITTQFEMKNAGNIILLIKKPAYEK